MKRRSRFAASLSLSLAMMAGGAAHAQTPNNKVVRFVPHAGETAPKFACRCSRERVSQMIRSLGVEEVESILAEQGQVEVACEFCGQQYRYDPIDAAGIFTGLIPAAADSAPPTNLH